VLRLHSLRCSARDCAADANMPLVPFAAAAVAPKAGAAMATAFAMGSDDLAHHVHDHAVALQDHATAFIRLPISKTKLWNIFVGPEVAAYHWVHDQGALLWHKAFGAGTIGPDQGRMVEYVSQGCPHCKNLEPIWKDAQGLWGQQSSADAHKVVWEQKVCLDENWKPGPDFKDCMAEHVQKFPTIRFFPPGSKSGEDFFLDRSPEQLVDFAKTGVNPNPEVMPRLPDDESDAKFVDFYAASCPHCKHLDPVWDDAHKQWDKAIGQSAEGPPRDDLPLVTFEKKQCYDEHWKPGKDSAECQKFHVDAFPTIKLFVPDPHGHGYVATDYTGDRTPEGMVSFLKKETGVDEYLQALAAEQKAAAVDASHHAGPVGVQVPDEIRAKAAEAAVASHAGAGADMASLQGSTPPMEDKALRDFQDMTGAAPAGEELPQVLKQGIKTAIMPLPLLACLPVRRGRRTSPASPQRAVVQSPPTAAAQFI